jgi:hypothetical protein
MSHGTNGDYFFIRQLNGQLKLECEICTRLRCYAASSGHSYQRFRTIFKGQETQGLFTLEVGSIGCPETSVFKDQEIQDLLTLEDGTDRLFPKGR